MKSRVLFLLAVLATSGGEVISGPLFPGKLANQKAAAGKMVPYLDGVLVECTDPSMRTDYMVARFDDKETTPVKIAGIELLLDAGTGSNGLIFLGLVETTGNVLKVVITGQPPEGKPQPLPVPDEFRAAFAGDLPGPGPRLIGTHHQAAAILDDTVWWFDKTWKHRKLPQLPKFHIEFLLDEPYSAHWFLDGTTLYGGWNHGEWGGALASLDLSAEDTGDADWVYLGDKPAKDDTGIPGHTPVEELLSPRKGELWVAAGCTHMGSSSRGIYHRDASGKWQTRIHGYADEDLGNLEPLIQSSISAAAMNRDGSLFILSSDASIFRMDKSTVEPLIAPQFGNDQSDRGDHVDYCYPSGIAIARTGDIFVSTHNYGVLAFRKAGDKWSGRQITIGNPEPPPPAPDSPPRPLWPADEK